MPQSVVSVTIANGTSLSGEANTSGHRLAAIIMPSGWTAASLNFEALQDQPAGLPAAPVFKPIVDTGGTEVRITTGGDRLIAIPLTHALGCSGLGRIKLRSGTSGVPVNQGADRVIKLVLVVD